MSAKRAPRHVVVFTKAPTPGDVKTRLASAIGPAAAAALARAFLLDALETALTVPHAEVTLAIAPPGAESEMRALVDGAGLADGARVRLEPQCGRDLGERMATALDAACARGAHAAAIIGSDSPTLPVRLVEGAFAQLETADLALGPADDGGYYLVAATRPLPAGMLDGVAWSSGRELGETVERARAHGLRVALLEPWYDVDGPADLERLSYELLSGEAGARHAVDAMKKLDLLEPARPHGV